MEIEELNSWKNDVADHIAVRDTMVNDRRILKKMIEEHLSKFFTWNEIIYDKDFTKITLRYKTNHGAVIKPELHAELGMDYIVTATYDDSANRVLQIELYPFGLPKDGEIVEI